MGPFPNFKRKFDFVLNFVLSKTIKKIFFALNSFCTGTEKLLNGRFFYQCNPFKPNRANSVRELQRLQYCYKIPYFRCKCKMLVQGEGQVGSFPETYNDPRRLRFRRSRLNERRTRASFFSFKICLNPYGRGLILTLFITYIITQGLASMVCNWPLKSQKLLTKWKSRYRYTYIFSSSHPVP